MSGIYSSGLKKIHDITIEDFSNSEKCTENSAGLLISKSFPVQLLGVEVCPNGICHDYVSFKVSKYPERCTADSELDNATLTLTLSVVDFDGREKCSQSFVIEYEPRYPYEESIPKFLRRSFLLSQADELLPGDVLTIRCELLVTYASSTVERFANRIGSSHEDLGPFFQEDMEKSGSSSKSGTVKDQGEARKRLELKKVERSLEDLMNLMFFPNLMDASYEQNMQTTLEDYDACDEIRKTYLNSNNTFLTYLALKERYRKSLRNGEQVKENIEYFLTAKDGEASLSKEFLEEWFSSYKDREMGYNTLLEKMMNVFGSCEEMLRYRLELFPNSSNVCERRECKSWPLNDEVEGFLGTDEEECFLTQKERESEKSTELDESFDFDMSPLLQIVTGMLGNTKEITEQLLEEHNLYKSSKNAIEKRECERETTAKVASGLSTDKVKCFSGIDEEEFFFNLQGGEKESSEDVRFELIFTHVAPLVIKAFGNAKEIIQCVLKECELYTDESADIVYEKKKYAGETALMASGSSNDEGKSFSGTGEHLIRKDGVRTNETHRPSSLQTNQSSEREIDPIKKHADAVIQFESEYRECVCRIANECDERKRKNQLLELNHIFKPFQQILEEIKQIIIDQSIYPLLKISMENFHVDPFQESEDSEVTVEPHRKREAMRLENYFDSVINYFLEDFIHFTANNPPTWNHLCIETMEGLTFTIPFEEGKETFGSKLFSTSKVFKQMLEHPMRESLEKRVELKDVDCETFMNFLQYLQTEDLRAESLSQLCSLYEFADEYEVPALMLLCAEGMQPLFSPRNIDGIEELACLHSDMHLIGLVRSYRKQNSLPKHEQNEEAEALRDENWASLKAQAKDQN